jgi:hypothetical protein
MKKQHLLFRNGKAFSPFGGRGAYILLMALVCLCTVVAFSFCSKDVYKENSDTPTYAASTKTWKFGEQIWSDAIQIPECNKSFFAESRTEPQCRSYSYEGKTYYYYNWSYVIAHDYAMCPPPWRVPTLQDASALEGIIFDPAELVEWQLGGYAHATGIGWAGRQTSYWTTTKLPQFNTAATVHANYDEIYSGQLELETGVPVRCVR